MSQPVNSPLLVQAKNSIHQLNHEIHSETAEMHTLTQTGKLVAFPKPPNVPNQNVQNGNIQNHVIKQEQKDQKFSFQIKVIFIFKSF